MSDYISKKKIMSHIEEEYKSFGEDYDALQILGDIEDFPTEERPHGECNQCRHYDGVHGVQGHAPCAFWRIGGVLSSDYCSRFEKGE